MSKLRDMLEDIGRLLTKQERAVVKWLLQWDRETIEKMDGLFDAVFKAGQTDGQKATFLFLLDSHGIWFNIDGDGALYIDEGDKDRAYKLADQYGMREIMFPEVPHEHG